MISEDQSIEEAQKAIEKTIKNRKEKVNREYQIYKKVNVYMIFSNSKQYEIIDFRTKAKPKDNYDWYKCS